MPGFEILGDDERCEVLDVLAEGALSRYARRELAGPAKADLLEQELSKLLGVEHVHTCSSGTAALSVALAAGGIGAGDEVIVPPFTFIATIEAVLMAGAVPVFADIDETLGLNPEAVAAAVTPRTRAIIPVHMCGSMARINELQLYCRQHGLILIEDTAQALGASYCGQMLGTFGDLGCFSFDAVKTITCGEGGAVVTRNRNLYELAAQYADHGHDHRGQSRGLDDHTVLGANFRLSELNAAVGLAQLRKLGRILEIQRAHKRRLEEALGEFPHILFRRIPDPAGDSATFVTFFLPDEYEARAATHELIRQGFSECIYWFNNKWHYLREWDHLQRMQCCGKFALHLLARSPEYDTLQMPASDEIMARTVSLQVKLCWTKSDLDHRLAAIDACFQQRGSRRVQKSNICSKNGVRARSVQPT